MENTEVTRREDADGNLIVCTTYVVHDTKSNRTFTRDKVETIPKAKPLNTLRPSRKQPAEDAKAVAPVEIPKEFTHCMKELLQTEKDFGTRVEAIYLHYEAPVRAENLLPPAAQIVVFGNNTAEKLVAASRACTEAWEATADIAQQIIIFWDYLYGARELYHDQVLSRAIGQAPLQGFLQSNRKFRKFATAKVPEVEKWFLDKGIQTHGHLGSVLFAPAQRLPRVLLLVMRMKEVWPAAPGLPELISLVQCLLEDFEQRNRSQEIVRPRGAGPSPLSVTASPTLSRARKSTTNACPLCREGFARAEDLVAHASKGDCKRRSSSSVIIPDLK